MYKCMKLLLCSFLVHVFAHSGCVIGYCYPSSLFWPLSVKSFAAPSTLYFLHRYLLHRLDLWFTSPDVRLPKNRSSVFVGFFFCLLISDTSRLLR
ncbi:Uncharacterized protein TCM_024201 [Theobroma cacao]|uniref:Secreted protein n=1 Tax=Theobroma cacao TaxID=3641 RepID=A0A061EV04_THECC|nr:Uncharacterized protein TCM_024201 [Theobroma cacao]